MSLWYIVTQEKEGLVLQYVPLCFTWDFSIMLTIVYVSLVISDLLVARVFHSLASYATFTISRHFTDTK